jgi:hypothetical protein
MARGWESKSVESQIEDAGAHLERGSSLALASEERDRKRQRSGLELSRKRVLLDLETAQSPVRRTPLEQALAHLDEEIRKLGG